MITIISGIGEFASQILGPSGVNYYLTAGPPQADLSALGIVVKKQGFARQIVRPPDVKMPPKPLV